MPTWNELVQRDLKSEKYNERLYELAYSTDVVFDGDLSVLKFEEMEGKKLKVCCYSTTGDTKTNFADFVIEFADGKYSLNQVGKMRQDKWPGHIDYDVSKLALKLKYGKNKKGILKFNETTAYCMCHSRYAMRIFDEDVKYAWENQDDVFGNLYPAVFDFDGDSIDEIIIFREDHGVELVLIFNSKSE